MNRNINNITSLFLLGLLLIISGCTNEQQPNTDLILWYQQPAEKWTEALPVGNGRLGAMIFGGVAKERIQLNEESLWAGEPINNNNPKAAGYLPQIQQLLLDGQIKKAGKLAEKYLLGTPPRIRSYQTLGDLWLESDLGDKNVNEYRRELDLSNGISMVTYNIQGTTYRYQTFVSAPDNVIIIRIEADKQAMINLNIGLERKMDAQTVSLSDQSLLLEGQINDTLDVLRGPAGKHMKFAARLIALNVGGKIVAENNYLKAEKVDALTLMLTAATNYNREKLGFDHTMDPLKICDMILTKAQGKSMADLNKRHVEDHQEIFNRVELNLGNDKKSNLPTDKRLQLVKDGAEDPQLIALYFQYGRYLLMGSSREPGVLPANLQGIWNEHFSAPWSSDFHTNINLQMNYWPADMCNLSEMVKPLSGFFTQLMKPGGITAQEMYGAKGWVMHHVTDPFGRTGLMDGVHWGTSPLAGAWMMMTFWRHYQFTRDDIYLAQEGYPMMKQAAQFILDFLIEDKDGQLVTAPSMSPENAYILPGEKTKYQLTYSATIDIQIIQELFDACISASEILGKDAAFASQLKETLERLPAIKIGKDGTIQEWIEDYDEAEPGHRHMSHLFGLHPGTKITPDTPELFAAAKKTIEKRLSHGGGHTGWSRAWIINFYARLLDGEKAHQHVLDLLRKSTLPNLFDTHPPFQIDGNFGGTSGIAEMLLQSPNNVVHILPALPKAWPKGFIKGLKTRGNFEVDIYWAAGNLEKVQLKSLSGGLARIMYNNQIREIATEKGETYLFSENLNQD